MRWLCLLLLTAGCAPVPRAAESALVRGASPEQVETALGRPDRRYRRVTPLGDLEIWSYLAFAPLTAMPLAAAPSAALEVDGLPVPALQDDETARVVFREGRLVAFEKRR